MSNLRPVIEKSISKSSLSLCHTMTPPNIQWPIVNMCLSIMKSLPKMKNFNQDLCFVMYITTDRDDKCIKKTMSLLSSLQRVESK